MSQVLAIQNQSIATSGLSRDQIELLKRTICRGATDDEFKLFIHAVNHTRLDPFMRQIHAVKRYNKTTDRMEMVIQTGIDGFRLIAERTGKYAGSDDPVVDDEKNPTRATVTVYKMMSGQRCPFTATARWDEYYPGEKQGFMWKKMPCLMLGKAAESLALRKAFPAELSGLYTDEEMEQAGDPNSIIVKPRTLAGEYVDPKSGDIFGGTWNKYNVAEIPTPELRKHKEYLESKPNHTAEELKRLELISEYLVTLDNLDPKDGFNVKEIICDCGSGLMFSDRKGVYYCPKFKEPGTHIKPIQKAQYEASV
jgi:phage recombination protein Bet